MKFLVDVFKNSEIFTSLEKAVVRGGSVCATGLSAVHKAHIIYSLCCRKRTTAFCVASDEREAQTICNDLASMGLRAYFYPERDFNFRDMQSASREYEHARLKVLLKLIDGECDVVVGCIDAAAQLTVPKAFLADCVLTLKEGLEISLEKAVRTLTLLGYERFDAVEGSGQFSVRGGILDFFMPNAVNPVRAEFWGDEITDLSFFDIDTQRRGEKAGEIRLSPSAEVIIEDKTELADKIEKLAKSVRGKKAAQVKETLLSEAESIRSGAVLSNTDKFIPLIYEKAETLFDYLGRDTLIFTSEFNNISERGRAMDFRNEETVKSAFEDGVLCRGLDKYSLTFSECVDILTSHGVVMLEGFVHGSTKIPLRKIVSFSAKQLSVWNGSYKQLEEDLNGMLTAESCGVVLAGTDKAAKNLCESLRNDGIPAQYAEELSQIRRNALFVLPGTLSAGFEYPTEKFFVITQGHISYVPKKKARKKTPKDSQAIYSLSELSQGDYVVHSVHGIGIFGGIRKIDTHGIVKDYIKIEYAKGDVLYVPVTQLDMVAKNICP